MPDENENTTDVEGTEPEAPATTDGDAGGGDEPELDRRSLIEAMYQGKEISDDGKIQDGPEGDATEPTEGEGQPVGTPTGQGAGQPTEEAPAGHTQGQPGDGVAPEHWAPADKELFARQPKEVQDYIMQRGREMDAAHTRRSQELADYRRQMEPMHNAIGQNMGYLQQIGIPPEVAFNELVNAERVLRTGTPLQKQQALVKMATDYGIALEGFDPAGVQTEAPGGDVAPMLEQYIQPLAGQVTQMQQFLQQQQQQQYQGHVSQLENEINVFKAAKGEDGQLSHPHFAEVENDMAALAQATVASGAQPNLQDLYDKAVWSNPSTREKLLDAQHKAASEKAEAERKKRVANAKQSKSTGPGSSGAAAPSEQPSSRREFIEQQYKEALANE